MARYCRGGDSRMQSQLCNKPIKRLRLQRYKIIRNIVPLNNKWHEDFLKSLQGITHNNTNTYTSPGDRGKGRLRGWWGWYNKKNKIKNFCGKSPTRISILSRGGGVVYVFITNWKSSIYKSFRQCKNKAFIVLSRVHYININRTFVVKFIF